MIAKVCKGSRSTGLLYYLLGPGREDEHVDPRVIGSWDGGEMLLEGVSVPSIGRMLDVGFEQGGVSSEKKVYHVPIRNHDSDRTLSDSEWVEVAREVMAETGISRADDPDGARWVLVRHDVNHVHLVATLVRPSSGKTIWPSHDYRAIRRVCNRMEDRFGILSTNPDVGVVDSAPTQAEMRMADGEVTDREQLQQAVRQARSVAKDSDHFFAELDRVGVATLLNRSEDGLVRGYSVGWPDVDGGRTVWFSGSKLSPELSYPKIVDHISARVEKQKSVPATESGVVSLRKETADAVRGAVELATSPVEFKALLAAVGVTVNYRTSGEEITGYAVGVVDGAGDEKWFPGSGLDPRLAWGPIKEKLVDVDTVSSAWNAEESVRREAARAVSAASKLGSSRRQFEDLVEGQGMKVVWRVDSRGEPVGYSITVRKEEGGEFRFAGSKLDNQPWSKVRRQIGGTGPDSGKYGLGRLVDVAKASAVSEDDFFGQLEASGAVIGRRFSSVNDGEVTGFRVGWEPSGKGSTVWYTGSELGRERSWPKIRQALSTGTVDPNVQGLRKLAVEAKRASSTVDEYFDALENQGISVQFERNVDGVEGDYFLAGVSGGSLSAELGWSTLQHQLDVDVPQLQALIGRTEKQINQAIAVGEIPDDIGLESEGLLTSLAHIKEGVMGGDLTDGAKSLRPITQRYDPVERSEVGQNLRLLAMGATVLSNNSVNDAAKLMLLVALAIEATRQQRQQRDEHRQAAQASKAAAAVEIWQTKQKSKPASKPKSTSKPKSSPNPALRQSPGFGVDPKRGPKPKM